MSSQPIPSSPQKLVFGPFTFEQSSGELQKHGVRVRLQGQPLQILAALIRQPGEVVSRDEFHRQLWNGTTFVDFEQGLNAAMNRLRQVLGDSADRPRYIETEPGRGYRFIAQVQGGVSKPIVVMESKAAPAVTPVVVRERRRGLPWWLAAAGVLAGLAGGYLFRARQPPSAEMLQFSVAPPVGFAIEAGSSRQTFALSPDGSRLAYTAMNSSGVFQTFIREFDALESRPLANSNGSYSLFWAPDGRSIFLTMRGKLKRSDLDGSQQVVGDTPGMMLTAAVRGRDLLISGRSANYIVPVSGGTPQPVKEIYQWPQMLPDGRHLIYTVLDSRLGRHRASVVNFGDPASAKFLIDSDSRVMYAPSVLNSGSGHLLFVRAGALLAQHFDPRTLRVSGQPVTVAPRVYSFNPTGAADFSVSGNGALAYKRYFSRSQLAWVNRRGEVLRMIGPANVNLKQARLSPDGKTIATAILDPERGVNDTWLIDAATGNARQIVAGRGQNDNATWSPDSAKLVFNRAYDTPPKLFLRGVGERDPEESLPPGYFQLATDWSPDGRFIAFTNTSFAHIENELKGDIWLIDLSRKRQVVHLVKSPFHEANATFSPDGRWLAFTSNESGRSEIYLQGFEAGELPRLVGERHQGSREGAISLRWARDGKELFYLASDGYLYALPITLSPKLKIGAATRLFEISTEARAAMHSPFGFDVSADRQRILIPIVTASTRSEIVVIRNWETARKLN